MCKDYDETEEKVMALVKKDGMALKDIPEKHKTSAVCLEAVRQYGWALKFVPEKLKTAELCLMAVRKVGMMLESVPEELKTAELCLVAVRECGVALGFVPYELRTVELCLMAVQQNVMAFKSVPKRLQSQVKTTLEKNGVLMDYKGNDGDVLIPKGITAIAGYAFRDEKTTHITLPEGLVSIGERAFAGCGLLTRIDIPKSVTEIGRDAFDGCKSLENIFISSKTALKFSGRYGPFYGCPGEEHIRYYEDEEEKDEHI